MKINIKHSAFLALVALCIPITLIAAQPVLNIVGYDGDPATPVVVTFDENQEVSVPVLTFSISNSPTLEIIDNQADFNLTDNGSGTYYLKFNDSPNFEIKSSYSVNITAQNNDGLAQESLSITINDVDDAPDIYFATSSVSRLESPNFGPEDKSTNLTVTATDPDSSDNDADITFAIVDHSDPLSDLDEDNNLFEIVSDTGVVTFKDSPDYDNPTDEDGNNQYQVYVSAESNSVFSYQSFTITITDLEEAPYFSLPVSESISHEENSVVAITLYATDPDTLSNTITYTISGVDSGQFNITPDDSTVGLANLNFIDAPDYENPTDADQDKTYQITITATDPQGTATSKNLSISTTDKNDDPGVAVNTSHALIDNITSNINTYETSVNAPSEFVFSQALLSELTVVDDDNGNLPELLLHLKLDDTAGTDVTDSSGKTNRDGVLVNADASDLTVSGDETDIGAYTGWDFSKDADAYIEISDATASDLSPEFDSRTVAFWYKLNNNSTKPLFYKGNKNSDGYRAYAQGTYTIFHADSSGDGISSGKNYSGDSDYFSNWHHFAGVLDRTSSNLILYIDGNPLAPQNLSSGIAEANTTNLSDLGNIDPSSPLYIGYNSTDGTYFDGLLDDFRIYGGALTQTQITELRQGTSLGIMTVTLSVSNGTLSLGDATQVSLVDGNSGVDEVSMTFSGGFTQINSALDGLKYNPNAEFSGADTLVLTVNDLDSRGSATSVTNLTINVQPINDDPVLTLNDPVMDEGDSINFGPSLPGGNLDISDDASSTANLELLLTLDPDVGDLSFTTTAGLTNISDGSALASPSIAANSFAITGTLDALNSALDTMKYDLANDPDHNGEVRIIFQVNDKGNEGWDDINNPSSGSQSLEGITDDFIRVTVTPLNDDPVITYDSGDVTASVIVAENTLVVDTITASDSDLSDDNSTENLSFSLSGTDANSFTIDAQTGLLSFNAGSIANFEVKQSYQVTVTVTDNSGATDAQTLTVNISDANDAPAFDDTQIALDVLENQTAVVSISDNFTDEDDDTLTYSLTGGADKDYFSITPEGVITLNNPQDFEATTPNDADNDNVFEIIVSAEDDGGTTDDANNKLSTLTPIISLTIINDNDPPYFPSKDSGEFPTSVVINEDETFEFISPNNYVSVGDPDVQDTGGDEITVTFDVVNNNGTIQIDENDESLISSGENNSELLTLKGNPSTLNAALNGFLFTPSEHYNGSESINVTIDDLGNKDGDPKQTAEAITITINPINDAPLNTIGPDSESDFSLFPLIVNEDDSLVLSQANNNKLSVSDPDSSDGSQELTLTLTITDGTLAFAKIDGLLQQDGSAVELNSPSSSYTFTGTITDINAALDGITFDPTPDFNSLERNAVIEITTTDGSLPVDSDTLEITVTAVNDAPAWTVPGAQTVNEDESLNFKTQSNVSQVDALTIENGGDGDVFTLSIDGNELDFSFDSSNALTATNLAVAVNSDNTLNALVNAADAGNGSVTLTANNAGTAFSSSVVTKTDNSGNASASIATTIANVSDTSIAISDDSSEDGSEIIVTIDASKGLLILKDSSNLTFDEAQGGTKSASTTTGASSYHVTGTVSAINAALQEVVYSPLPNVNGSDTINLSAEDQGNYGSGNNNKVVSSVSVTITPINDGPSVATPVSIQQINEDEPITFNTANGNAISVTDPDAAEINDELEVTVSALFGTITLSTISNLTFSEGSGPTGSTMKFTGTEANLNTALNDLIYTPSADHNDNAGSEVITIQVSDQGHNGTEVLTATATISVEVTAINDTPSIVFSNTNPVTDEDTILVLSSANTNGISITDDASESNKVIQVTLTAANGILTLASTDGLTFNGLNGSASFIMAGTMDKISTALDGLQYLPGPGANGFGFNGTDTVTVFVQDLGSTGTGGFLEATNSLAVTVNVINDAPVHLFNDSSVSVAQTTNEDTPLSFSSANGNAITVTDDSDEGDTIVQVSLSVDSGSLTLSSTENLTFTTGDGEIDGNMTFSGKLTDINTALEGLLFAPAADSSATATMTIVTDDQGNNGTGNALTDTDSVVINVTAINDAPTLTFANNAPTTSEDLPLLFNADANTLITLSDDASEDGSQISLKFSVTAGTLTLPLEADALTNNNIGIIAGANNSSNMTLTGAVDKLSLVLDGLQYNAPLDFVGTVTLTLIADDLGNYGEGDPLQVTSTATINVSAVNDAPVLELPGDSFVNEDNSLTFSSANNNAIVVSDPDTYSDSSAIQATMKLVDDSDADVSDRGTFSLGSNSGLTFTSGDGNDDASMVFLGSLTAVNTALDGLIYTPPADYNGEVYLKTIINDQGNLGAGSALTNDTTAGADEVKITIVAYNDAPFITAEAALLETEEDTVITFNSANSNALSVVDVDYDETTDGLLLVTLSVTNGKLTLNSTADLDNNFTFLIGNGSEDSAMIFSTTEASLNTALDGMTYTPNADYNESDGTSTLSLTISDQGQTGSGGTLTATQSIPITVKAINDSPVVTLISEATIEEDNTYSLASSNGNAITITDVDTHESIGTLTVTLSVSSGTITAPNLGTDVSVVSGDGIDDSTLVFSGTPAQATIALEGLTYTPSTHFNGSDSLVISLNDGGNQGGDGSSAIGSATLTLNVTAINDAPELILPGTQITDEDTTILFSSATGNSITTSDADAAETEPGKIQLSLSVAHGTLKLATLQDITLDSGADESDTMTLSATPTQLNTALEGLVYTPVLNYNGDDTLALSLSDLGLTGSGGTLTVAGNVILTLNSINDAPVISFPNPPTIDEDTIYTFSTALTNGISLADVDIDASPMTIALSVNDGTLKLGSTTDILFNAGIDESSTMTLQGTLSTLNTALDGIIFTPNTQFNGTSTFSIVANDGGASGSGGVLETTQTLDITISALNDAPTLSLPEAPTINEDSSITFSVVNGNAIILADDATETLNEVELSLAVNNGTLRLGATDGVTITEGADGSTTITLNGNATAISEALDGLTYIPNPGANAITMDGAEVLHFVADDLGGHGTGGSKTTEASLDITVEALNDAPVLTAPATASTEEDTQLIFSTANSTLISFSDDATEDGSNVQLQLTTSHGIITLNTNTGISIIDGADASTTMTLLGNVINLNNAIDGLSYSPDPNFNGIAQLQSTINDLGNAGSGIAESATKTVNITVNAINDGPSITVPAGQTTDEDSPITFSTANSTALSVADADVGEGTGDLQFSLGVNFGTLAIASTDGLAIVAGAENSNSLTLRGIPDKINLALEGLVYTPNPDINDDDILTLVVSDLGDTGSGGEQNASSTVAITINAINDAPINQLPIAQITREDQALTFSTATSNLFSIYDDAPEGSTALEVQLSVDNGTLTLASTANLTITAGSDASDSLTLTGQFADINTALDGLIYTPTADHFGSDTLTVSTSDNGGTGIGGTLTDSDTLAITVQPVNDAPVNTLPLAQNTNEETSLTFSASNQNAISVYDDASDAGLSFNVSLEATNGILTLSSTDNLELTGGSLNPGTTLHISGKMDDINAALSSMTYTPNTNFTGEATLTLTTNDLGNEDDFGSEALTVTDTLTITVNEVNDAPILDYPEAVLTSSEDSLFTFSEAQGLAITVTDPDIYGVASTLKLTLSVDSGTLNLPDTTGLSIISGSNNSAAMVLLGTPENLNLSLEGMTLTPTTDFTGTLTLSLTADDQGNSGTGGSLTASGELQIYHAPTNDAPLITLPEDQSLDEDGVLTLTGSVLQVNDDAEANDILITQASAIDGTLKLSDDDSSGVTIIQDGSSGTLEFSGTLEQINNAFNGFTFIPNLDYTGEATVNFSVNDQGAGGSGGSKSGSSTLLITVSAVNDAPTIILPEAQTVELNNTLVLSSSNSNSVSVSDIDAGAEDILQISLQTVEGTITLSSTENINLVSGDGIADTILVFTSTINTANAALDGMSFTPSESPETTSQIQVAIDDQGNNGTGGARSSTETLDILIDHKPPVIIQGDSINASVEEDKESTWTIPEITATDPNDEVLTWALHAQASKGTASVSGTGNTPTVTYSPNADYNGEDSFSIKVTDASDNIDTITVFVNVAPLNDAPVITSSPVTTTADQDYFYTIKASDADGDMINFNSSSLPSWLNLQDNVDGTATLSGTYSGESGGVGQLLTDAADLSQGWRYSEWFGVFYEDDSGWLYQDNLGWVYVPNKSTTSIWLWTEKLGWVWTSPPVYHQVVLSVSDGSTSITHDFTLSTGIFPSFWSPDSEIDWIFYEATSSSYPFFIHKTQEWISAVSREITVTATLGGSVTGAGTYEMGDIVSLTATPDTGYKFTNWSINDVIVSTEVTYQYSVKADEVLKANFAELDATDYLDLFD